MMSRLLPMSRRLLQLCPLQWTPRDPLLRPRNILLSLTFLRKFSHDRENPAGKFLLLREVKEKIETMVASPEEIERLRSSGVESVTSEKLPPRNPEYSRTRAVIPLESDIQLREHYISATKDLRIGRILEEVDNFAGFCCFKHNREADIPDTQATALLVITVLVDQIDIDVSKPPLSQYKDIIFDGKVTWTGRSSMESTVTVEQELDGKVQQFMKATLVFVIRDPISFRAASISPLELVSDKDKKAFEQGKENSERRIQDANRSVLKMAPSREESLLIHEMFLSYLDQGSQTLQTRTKPKDSVWMEETILQSSIVCYPTHRNVFHKIYGGFVMRKTFELALTTATVHSKCLRPRLKKIDDMHFLGPVEIGSLLFFSSQIVYNNGSDLQIRVRAKQIRMGHTESQDITNDCHFTFDCSGPLDKDFVMPRVLPKTYAEAMLYVDGKRRYDLVGQAT